MRLFKLYIFFAFVLISSCYFTDNKKPQTNKVLDIFNKKHAKTKIKFKDFEHFYNKFISDSLFQISNIKFPIQGVYADHEGEEEWTKEKWPLIKFNLTENNTESVDSIYIIQSENSFFYGNYCTDCGFSFEMSFKKIKHQWYLVYRQENNY